MNSATDGEKNAEKLPAGQAVVGEDGSAAEQMDEELGIRTKEGAIAFVLKVNCKLELLDEHILEITANAGKLPKDEIVLEHGLEIRNSLTTAQKANILAAVRDVTKNDVAHCLANDIVQIHGHVRRDYIQRNPRILTKRGFSTDESKLLREMIHILCNLNSVEKATVKFHPSGDSKETLSYTVAGELNGKLGRLAFNFDKVFDEDGNEIEGMLVVTILDPKPL
ncbi:hypothetical protein [Cohnella soli]|uniref:Uncharacterized protein n=1 Tax=Cohnella soli TaxID=425005 RepID=A0ABW0HQI4_9BACL